MHTGAGIIAVCYFQLQLIKENDMTLIATYPSKKECKAHIGKPLRYIETSLFGPEYQDNGILTVCNRPHITGLGREWFGRVTVRNGIIEKVE